MIVSELSDSALRIVLTVIGDPVNMLEKLDTSFNSKSATTTI